MLALDRNPQVPVPTPHKVLGPGIDGRGILKATEQLAWGLAFPEATRVGPEVPSVGREHLPKLEKIQEVLPSTRDEARFH